MVSNVSRHHIGFLAITIVLSIASTSVARAEIGLVVVGGSAKEHERATISSAVESAMRTAGWSLPSKPVTKKESDGLLNCKDATTPWTCVPASLTTRGVRNVFVVSVEMTQAANGAPLVVITGRMIATEPPEFAFGQRFCEHCADDKLTEAGADLTRQLIDDLATRAGRTVVHFTSVPSEADIILDGTKLGATDATYSTHPGKHTAMIQKAGYVSQVKEFTAEQGKTAEVSFTLVRSDAPAPEQISPETPSWLRRNAIPAAAIGVGTPIAVVGGILLYRGLHGSDQYDYPRATAVGIPMEIVGLGAIGTGIYLLLRADHGTGPSVTPAHGGAVVGWSGRF